MQDEEELSEEMRRHLAGLGSIVGSVEARDVFPSDDDRMKYFEFVSDSISCSYLIYDSADALPVEDGTVRYVSVSDTKHRILSDSHVGNTKVGRVSSFANVPFDGLPMARLISDFQFDAKSQFLMKIVVTDDDSKAVINHLVILPQDPFTEFGARVWEKIKSDNVGLDTRNISGAGVGVPNVCASCGKTGLKLRHCEVCKIIWYCGKECQRADWSSHKIECNYLAGTQRDASGSGQV